MLVAVPGAPRGASITPGFGNAGPSTRMSFLGFLPFAYTISDGVATTLVLCAPVETVALPGCRER